MNGTVTVYFSTGFNGVDIPADASVLASAPHKVYPDVYYIREDLDKPFIKIKDTYDNLANVDYCKIETSSRTCYFFAVPSSLSQGVTQLALDLDALLTMGGAKNLDYSSGWQERGHIRKVDDVLFDNIASEAWTPSQPLVAQNLTMIESNKSEISGQDTGDNRDIIVTNVDFTKISELGEGLIKVISGVKQGGTSDMDMPRISTPDRENSTFFGIWDDEPVPGDPTVPPETKNFVTPGLVAYDLNNTNVRIALEGLYSAGQLQLQSSYRIPWMYIDEMLTQLDHEGATYDPDTDTGRYTRIVGYRQIYNANQIPFEYNISGYTIKNKKTLETYRNYIIVNLGSGDMSIKAPHEIYNRESPTQAPAVRIWADPLSTGKPYARFDYIVDNPLQWADTVKGLPWASAMISLDGASGSAWNSIQNAFTSQNIQRAMQQNDLDSQYSTKLNALSQRMDDIQYQTQTGIRSLDKEQLAMQGGSQMLKSYYKPTAKNLFGTGNTILDMTRMDMEQGLATSRYQYETINRDIQNEQNARNSALASARMQQQLNENEIDLYKNNNVVAPTLMFTPEQNLGLYGYNKFAVYEVRKSDEDLKSEDMYYQRFGYSGLHRPLKAECFNTREYYSYVQAFNVNIKSNFGLRIRQKAIAQLNSGVRVWKVLPDASYYELN